jgi:hypothetical protein
VVAMRGKDFQCVAVTAPPSIKDLNAGGRPKPPPSSAPRLVCTGGAVRRGECLCPGRLRKVQAGPNAWRCVSPAAKTAR